MQATSGIYKRNYYQGDHTNCARFMVCQALGTCVEKERKEPAGFSGFLIFTDS